jgi:hypothetical protein
VVATQALGELMLPAACPGASQQLNPHHVAAMQSATPPLRRSFSRCVETGLPRSFPLADCLLSATACRASSLSLWSFCRRATHPSCRWLAPQQLCDCNSLGLCTWPPGLDYCYFLHCSCSQLSCRQLQSCVPLSLLSKQQQTHAGGLV